MRPNHTFPPCKLNFADLFLRKLKSLNRLLVALLLDGFEIIDEVLFLLGEQVLDVSVDDHVWWVVHGFTYVYFIFLVKEF